MTSSALPPSSGTRPACSSSDRTKRVSNLLLHPAFARRFDRGLEEALMGLSEYRTGIERLALQMSEFDGSRSLRPEGPPMAAESAMIAEAGLRLGELAEQLLVIANDLEAFGPCGIEVLKTLSEAES